MLATSLPFHQCISMSIASQIVNCRPRENDCALCSKCIAGEERHCRLKLSADELAFGASFQRTCPELLWGGNPSVLALATFSQRLQICFYATSRLNEAFVNQQRRNFHRLPIPRQSESRNFSQEKSLQRTGIQGLYEIKSRQTMSHSEQAWEFWYGRQRQE